MSDRWETDPFLGVYLEMQEHTAVSADCCCELYMRCCSVMHLNGRVAECGVYRGGTAYVLASAMKGYGKTLELFDAFADNSDYMNVKQFLSKFEKNNLLERTLIDYNIGDVQDALIVKRWEKEQYCFIHINVDSYISALTCLQYFYPLLVTGGIIICHNNRLNGSDSTAKVVVDEYMADKPESVVSLTTKQSMVVKSED